MDAKRAEVDNAITQALEATLPDQLDIDRDSPLSAASGLDSVQIMNLVMELEDHLDISVPVDVLAEAQTLNELAERIVPLLAQK